MGSVLNNSPRQPDTKYQMLTFGYDTSSEFSEVFDALNCSEALSQGGSVLRLETYRSSTWLLAQGVLRKNLSDDFTEGSFLKQFTLILWAKPSQPYCPWRLVTIASKVMPWSGLLGWLLLKTLVSRFG